MKNLLAGYEPSSLLDKLLYLDTKLYLQDDILVKVDRASMACSPFKSAPLSWIMNWLTGLSNCRPA
ncbi:MAG TPA: hypothetical protein DCK87_02955 [Desulfotomaculum sp.]|nr:hypothetical protein [Desulfotomaculum sp.]